jgi:hypothetical protein
VTTGLMTVALVASVAVPAFGLWPLLLLALADPLLRWGRRLRRRPPGSVVDAAG